MNPATIDEVLAELDQIIHQVRETRDRLGYFAVLPSTNGWMPGHGR